MKEGSRESGAIPFHLLSRYQKSFPRGLIRDVEAWLSDNLCDNWAAVDDLCSQVLTPLVRPHPDLVPRVKRWSRSKNMWLRRASAVTFVPLARRGERLDDAYEVAESLFGDVKAGRCCRPAGSDGSTAGSTMKSTRRATFAHWPRLG